jgi:hypothetical protein
LSQALGSVNSHAGNDEANPRELKGRWNLP